MLRAITIFLAAVLLSACGTVRFADASGAEPTQRDLLECEHEATKVSAGIRDVVTAAIAHVEIRNSCLALRGFKPAGRKG